MPDKTTYKERNGTTRVGDLLRSMASAGKFVAPELLELASNITGIEALEKIGNKIKGQKELSEADKMMLQASIDLDKQDIINVTKRWEADMTSDNILSKSIRPLTLAYLTISLSIFVLLDSAIANFTVKEQWISLLETLLLAVYLAYFGSRGVEKFKKISKQ